MKMSKKKKPKLLKIEEVNKLQELQREKLKKEIENQQKESHKWITRLRRGMIVKFPDGRIDVVDQVGYIGKSDKHPEKKGRHFFTTSFYGIMVFWHHHPGSKVKILGFNKSEKKRRK